MVLDKCGEHVGCVTGCPTEVRRACRAAFANTARRPTGPTAAPTPRPTALVIDFCSNPEQPGWSVPTGRMLYGRTYGGIDCLMQSDSDTTSSL